MDNCGWREVSAVGLGAGASTMRRRRAAVAVGVHYRRLHGVHVVEVEGEHLIGDHAGRV